MRNILCLLIIIYVFGCSQKQDVGSGVLETSKPNIIYILADDLGYGDLSVYGQTKFKTPNIDQLAASGKLFTQHYAGSTVCAPSRASLMTGLHTGHSPIRANKEVESPGEGQIPLPDSLATLAEVLKSSGYTTGAFGKWGLGFFDTEGNPLSRGFDRFYGYNCQVHAHRYYPEFYYDDDKKISLPANENGQMGTYLPDQIHQETLNFIRENKDELFFAYVATVIPHAELIVPEDSIWAKFENAFPETPWGFNNKSGNPYQGNSYGAVDFDRKGYQPQQKPRAAFASMITRLDHHVGEIVSTLKEQGIYENTLIIFASDNGPHEAGGGDPDFFKGYGSVRGYKRDLYEGGIRVPMIASWPGVIEKSSVTDSPSAFYDVLPTLADIVGADAPRGIDGISFAPLLTTGSVESTHDYFYWEFPGKGGLQAVRKGKWKAVRLNTLSKERKNVELFNLEEDPRELRDVSAANPEILEELLDIMSREHVPNEIFPLFHHELPS